jgi:hypothetical protein
MGISKTEVNQAFTYTYTTQVPWVEKTNRLSISGQQMCGKTI